MQIFYQNKLLGSNILTKDRQFHDSSTNSDVKNINRMQFNIHCKTDLQKGKQKWHMDYGPQPGSLSYKRQSGKLRLA